MPVHAVPGGWRWGKSGKTYRTKAAAERQARAAYAAGWKEDGSPRPKKRAELHRALSPPRKAEGRYVRDLVSVMARIHEGVFEVVKREWPAPQERRDKDEDAFGLPFRRRLFKYVDDQVGKAHDRMSDDVVAKGGQAARAIGISPQAAGLSGIVAGARAANVDLIQNAAVSFVDDVRKVLDESEGLRHEEIAQLLEERAGVSRRRAELIARDQTAKLAGALNHARQKAAGITSFTWSTSNDERVRESHAELEGEQFAYDDPPEVDGEPTLPTEAVNCRCVAIPVLTDDEDEEPEAPDETIEPEPPESPPEPEPEAPVLDLDDHFARVHEERNAGMTAADVVSGMKHEGVARWMKELPPRLNVLKTIEIKDPKTGLLERGVEGYWEQGGIQVAADISPPHQQDMAWGHSWRVTDRRATVPDKVRSNFVHELGHHVHLGAVRLGHRDVDEVIQKAYAARGGGDVRKVARVLAWKSPSPAISRYAMKNYMEYFAESFNAYLEDNEALKAHDPIGYGMVAQVLRLIGAE